MGQRHGILLPRARGRGLRHAHLLYADPYSSYQRGTNENRNGRIRRYLPKRTSFDDLTDADLQAIVDEINDTPMKVLDWETPNEV